MKTDNFWYTNVDVLYKKQRLLDFVPLSNHTLEEKLNAIVRFTAYASILFIMTKFDINYIFIFIFGLLFTYFIYYLYLDGFQDISRTTLPTKENPFMNILIPEYVENPERGKAADLNNATVKEEVEKYFNENLYRDVDDIWDKANSQRQWYTMPATTIPNDRDAFMEWCYDTKKVCKDGDLDVCNKYDDLRAGHV